ncbi:hypothetical protein B481_1747 [Planococcus halocryophilus Or1]|nr:hypothetical protein B481_1747 [Planococcus halocryophilus Or1]
MGAISSIFNSMILEVFMASRPLGSMVKSIADLKVKNMLARA